MPAERTCAVGRWTLRVDVEATRAAYAAVPAGGTDRCRCEQCVNFERARERAYPPELRALLEELGVDWRKEAEACHLTRLRPGWHLYNGWFHVVAVIESGREAWRRVGDSLSEPDFERLGDSLQVGISTREHLLPAPFRGRPVVQLELLAEVPWVLGIPEPEEPAE